MNPERILVFRIAHLGDTIVALPALWALRNTFPSAHIAILSNVDVRNPHYISPDRVLPREGLIDEFIAYPTNLGRVAKAAAMLKLGVTLRRKRFDGVVYLMPRVRTVPQIERDEKFFRLAAGIDTIVGTRYLRSNRLDEDIPIPTPEIESEAAYLLHCVSENGFVESHAFKTDLLLNDDENAAARDWFEKAAQTSLAETSLVAVAPGSKWGSKLWPEERFAAVVEQLIERFDIFPVVFGGGEDRETGDRLIRHWKIGVNSASELSVRESAALLRHCSLYLGNDTGTMHLAAAVGIPCVAVFAAIDWVGKWTPFGDNNRVFRKSVECEGCHSPTCHNNRKCLDMVSADEVLNACVDLLEQKG